MVTSCSAYGCKNRFDKNKNISFHVFPKNAILLKKWLIAVKRKDLVPGKNSKLCSAHFLPQDFIRNFGTKTLKPNVCPSVLNCSDNIKKKRTVKRSSRSKVTEIQASSVQMTSKNGKPSSSKKVKAVILANDIVQDASKHCSDSNGSNSVLGQNTLLDKSTTVQMTSTNDKPSSSKKVKAVILANDIVQDTTKHCSDSNGSNSILGQNTLLDKSTSVQMTSKNDKSSSSQNVETSSLTNDIVQGASGHCLDTNGSNIVLCQNSLLDKSTSVQMTSKNDKPSSSKKVKAVILANDIVQGTSKHCLDTSGSNSVLCQNTLSGKSTSVQMTSKNGNPSSSKKFKAVILANDIVQGTSKLCSDSNGSNSVLGQNTLTGKSTSVQMTSKHGKPSSENVKAAILANDIVQDTSKHCLDRNGSNTVLGQNTFSGKSKNGKLSSSKKGKAVILANYIVQGASEHCLDTNGSNIVLCQNTLLDKSNSVQMTSKNGKPSSSEKGKAVILANDIVQGASEHCLDTNGSNSVLAQNTLLGRSTIVQMTSRNGEPSSSQNVETSSLTNDISQGTSGHCPLDNIGSNIVLCQNTSSGKRKRSVPVYVGDAAIEDFHNPEKMKRLWEIAKKTVKDQKHKIKYLQTKLNRREKKIQKLQDLVTHLREINRITPECQTLLQVFSETGSDMQIVEIYKD